MDPHPNLQFRTIGLLAKYADPVVCETLKAITAILQQRGLTVLVDERSSQLAECHGAQMASRRVIGESCDLAIVVGGDGTFLNAARSLVSFQVPLLGINLGRLGFLTDVSLAAVEETLDQVLTGHYVSENRCLLHATILRGGEVISESDALNDVVIHKWNVARMIEFETYVNGKFAYTLRSDGLIVSTPTGSTAYALSGGGPIIYPDVPVTLLVPICPHTLSNRPLVVPCDAQIEIVVSDSNQDHAQVTCDGQINLGLISGDRVIIQKRNPCIRLIHPENYDYFRILREKLHWSKRLYD